jgi:hypothetical protein
VFQLASLFVVSAVIAMYVPNAAVLGVFAGITVLVLIHLIWIVLFRRVMKRRAAPPAAPPAGAGTLPPSMSTASGTNLP